MHIRVSVLLIVEDLTVTMKCTTAVSVFEFMSKCNLNSLSRACTSISLLVKELFTFYKLGSQVSPMQCQNN